MPSQLLRAAQAGTIESNDIMVTVTPAAKASGLSLTLVSPVLKQYGRQIRSVIEEVLASYDIKDVQIHANDKGALDCTIRARLTVAIQRALSTEEA
jgi:citrate lyase subunit gamma (acyl carrier protein)